jgi:ornithine carbamoyltransferase
MTARHFLEVTDLSVDEVGEVLRLAQLPVAELGRPMDGMGAALIFDKPSNRTRQSMEMAVVQLGGHPVYTRGDEVGLDVREPVGDVVKIMEGYHALLAARVFSHSVVERMAAVASIPVVNMLSDRAHPLQGLADALTMEQQLGRLAGRTVAYVGDYNNVARSLGEVSVMLGAEVRFAGPAGYQADAAEIERLRALGPGDAVQTTEPADAVRGASAVHTDTWVSMGQEDEAALRKQDFAEYCVDADLMALAAPDAIFMHCLPAYRGVEVATDVIDGPQSRIYQQGHNRLHSARGLLAFLMEASR